MRVRVVLGAALLAVLVVFAIDMSGSAPRLAGWDHTNPVVFSVAVPHGGQLCQPAPFLPPEAASMRFLLGTYGKPAPSFDFTFTTAAGAVSATADLPAGVQQGTEKVAIKRVRGAGETTNMCVQVGGKNKVVLAGESGPASPANAVVQGQPQGGRVSLFYLRRGSESWWQLLPTLITRLGLGKAPLFGDWTLPVLALLLAGVWIASLRLLARELR
jgi:hypothetical protein